MTGLPIQTVREEIAQAVEPVLIEGVVKRRNDVKGTIDVLLRGSRRWLYEVQVIGQCPMEDLVINDFCICAKFGDRWYCLGSSSRKAHVTLTEEHVTRHGADGGDKMVEVGTTEPVKTFPGKLWVDTT